MLLPELCSAERFAELCALPLPSVLSKAAELGEDLAPRAPLSRDTLELLALECGVNVSICGVDAHRCKPGSRACLARWPLHPVVSNRSRASRASRCRDVAASTRFFREPVELALRAVVHP